MGAEASTVRPPGIFSSILCFLAAAQYSNGCDLRISASLGLLSGAARP